MGQNSFQPDSAVSSPEAALFYVGHDVGLIGADSSKFGYVGPGISSMWANVGQRRYPGNASLKALVEPVTVFADVGNVVELAWQRRRKR